MDRQTLATIALVIGCAAPAAAQVDPLLFIKRNPANGVDSRPNVLVMVDTANRMQRDAPTDPANPLTTSNYYDPFPYLMHGKDYEAPLGVSATTTLSGYRRKYVNLSHASSGSDDKFRTATISVVTDRNWSPDANAAALSYNYFYAPTRLAVVRAALHQAITENKTVARFGLYKMRQNPSTLAEGNSGAVANQDPAQSGVAPTDWPSGNGRWAISRPTPSGSDNGHVPAGIAYSTLVAADANADPRTTNQSILTLLGNDVYAALGSGGLVPAGSDDANTVDAPVDNMLVDLKTEAARLVQGDTLCRNTVAILITGGKSGTTSSGDTTALATSFLTFISGRRVPVIVIAIAPPSDDVTALQAIATASGGQYFEISKADIDEAIRSYVSAASANGTPAFPAPAEVAGTVLVPKLVRAIEIGVQTAFQDYTDLNTAKIGDADVTWPWYGFNGYAGSAIIPSSEFQVTSPIVGTVNLEGAKDITGTAELSNTIVYDKANNKIPQRSNVLLTTAFSLPGFDGLLRAFRVYKPTTDGTQLSGYKFIADGTRLWVASTPSDPSTRNLYTALPNGTMIAFTAANAAVLAPLMNLSLADATAVITHVRSQPLGAVVDSTPAIMNPPSLDPPPDDDYPAFAQANKNRRSIVWVGTNRGILEAIDARDGVEVWGFIPLNLLPKLRTIRDGQPVGTFDYFVDGSPKVADVKIDDTWKTYMIMGEGPGGTFYQTFDVTLTGMSNTIDPASDSVASLLSYFSDVTRIPLVWTFPRYSSFDPTIRTSVLKYGDLSNAATTIEKTVGQTWSDPAVGEVVNSTAPYTVLIGSGFLPYSVQHQSNRGDTVAGTTFYILNAADGAVLATKDVGNDGNNETSDDCAAVSNGCRQIKNALQTDPVATGPSDSRFITKAYIGDLDGRLWRIDVNLDATKTPTITGTTKLYEAGTDQPIFASMATVNVGGAQQYVFFGTGSDLLPGTDKNTIYHMLGVLDNGTTGSKTMDLPLTKTASATGVTVDERVTAYPAVAGDIVFFTTTTFKPSTPCTAPDANLYAFTFIGGPAYDTSNDGTVTTKDDSTRVKTIAGQRATAPFIVDQHLVFGAGGKLELFGDPNDFNNGIGQAGVRILSWRQVR